MFKYLQGINKKVTSKDYPSNYFAVNIDILTIATLWRPENKGFFTLGAQSPLRYRAYELFSMFSFIFCVLFCTPSEFVALQTTWGDINAFIMNLGIALTHLVANIKILNWYIRRRQICELMSSLNRADLHYEPSEDFEPGLIVQRAKKQNDVVSSIFFFCGTMVPVSGYIMGALYLLFNREAFYFAKEGSKGGEEKEFRCVGLPFYSWIPFEHGTEYSCLLAMIFQAFPMIYITLMIIGVDTMFMGLANCITAHLGVLQGAFRTIRARAIHDFNSDFRERKDVDRIAMHKMKKCLKHLQLVQRLCKKMEDIYSMQTLCQVMTSLFVLCTCLFLLSTEPMTSKTFLVEVIYVLAIEYQLTLYCWFGNELTLASIGIPQALYESDWLSGNTSFRRCVLITMIRMKQPLYLTVGKFTPLTLETLQAILRGSYSLCAVLKKTNPD